jgi:hypothetical protein
LILPVKYWLAAIRRVEQRADRQCVGCEHASLVSDFGRVLPYAENRARARGCWIGRRSISANCI